MISESTFVFEKKIWKKEIKFNFQKPFQVEMIENESHLNSLSQKIALVRQKTQDSREMNEAEQGNRLSKIYKRKLSNWTRHFFHSAEIFGSFLIKNSFIIKRGVSTRNIGP